MMENSTEVFLKEFHQVKPSCTSKSFVLSKTDSGTSSYDAIANEIENNFTGTLLDLACGDGFLLEMLVERGLAPSQLFGIDMSDGELAVAQGRLSLNGVDLRIGNARSLPYQNNSFDIVSCHMALMLMPNVHEVLIEISRVLRPGGKLLAVLSGSSVQCDTMKFYIQQLKELLSVEGKSFVGPLGDRAMRDASSIREVFEAAFVPSQIEFGDFTVEFQGEPNVLAASMLEFYDVFVLSPKAQAELEHRLFTELKNQIDQKKKIGYSIGLRKIIATKSMRPE